MRGLSRCGEDGAPNQACSREKLAPGPTSLVARCCLLVKHDLDIIIKIIMVIIQSAADFPGALPTCAGINGGSARALESKRVREVGAEVESPGKGERVSKRRLGGGKSEHKGRQSRSPGCLEIALVR